MIGVFLYLVLVLTQKNMSNVCCGGLVVCQNKVALSFLNTEKS
jgi:hypothetical protein